MKPAFHTASPPLPIRRSPLRRASAARSCASREWELPLLDEPIVTVSNDLQPELGREVQIKQLRPFAANDLLLREAFIKELRTTAQLRHPSLVQVFEAHLQDEQPYVVLERLYGPTLQQRLDQLRAQGRQMDPHEAGAIVAALADLLEYTQRRGVRVYAFQPEAIILSAEGHPVLTALGSPPRQPLQRLAAEELAFIAPECLAGASFDSRSEIYALGVLLALLLSGHLPFAGDAQAMLACKERGQPLPLLDHPTSAGLVPALLAPVLRRATAADPAQRYESAAALQHNLLEALDQLVAQPEPTRLPTLAALPLPVELSPVVQTPAIAPIPAPIVAAPPVAATTPELPMADPMLLPGMEREEFRAALPYVVLVPLPDVPQPAAQAAPAATAAASAVYHGGVRMTAQLWLLLALTLAVTIGAALTLG